jgi:hypothetical protein
MTTLPAGAAEAGDSAESAPVVEDVGDVGDMESNGIAVAAAASTSGRTSARTKDRRMQAPHSGVVITDPA